jgi:hypothetical protein
MSRLALETKEYQTIRQSHRKITYKYKSIFQAVVMKLNKFHSSTVEELLVILGLISNQEPTNKVPK